MASAATKFLHCRHLRSSIPFPFPFRSTRCLHSSSSTLYQKTFPGSGTEEMEILNVMCKGAYWAPHPKTGIFGPPTPADVDSNAADDRAHGRGNMINTLELELEVERSVFFRALENLDKPPSGN